VRTQHRGDRMVTVLLVGGAWCMAACNPYKCGTDARSATYVGLLGHSAPPVLPVAETDSGRVFLMLNEWRGSMSQQNVIASVAIRGFVSRVSEIHVHEGAPANPGRLLLRSVSGYLVGDSAWKTGIDLFAGPASWQDLWTRLDDGDAYFEIHSPSGDSISAGLGQAAISDFWPSCT